MQNGEVKPVKAAAAQSLQIVNETKAAEQPAECTTSSEQQGAAESAPLVLQDEKETKTDEPSQEGSPLTEETSNGPTVSVEV